MDYITMCSGVNCPVKEMCYRYKSKDYEDKQSYFTNPPIKDDKCDMFWGENSQGIFNMLKDII